MRFIALLLLPLSVDSTDIDPIIQAYRDLISIDRFGEKPDTSDYATTALHLRDYMISNDVNYPSFHATAPEGWLNDPNGVSFDPVSKLYHRFYQYNKNFNENCSATDQRNNSACSPFDLYPPDKINPREWGHIVSRDLKIWSDWPSLISDSPYDKVSVFSGNCIVNETNGHPTCIYTGIPSMTVGAPSFGVCATSTDWINWEKSGCMSDFPGDNKQNEKSQVNHDSAIYSWGGRYYMLSGGCTYTDGSNDDDGTDCRGNAQIWVSDDLKTWKYSNPIHLLNDGGGYWELPYLLPFDSDGNALRNDQIDEAESVVLLVGRGSANIYFTGEFDTKTNTFAPSGGSFSTATLNADTGCSYSYNVHLTDIDSNGNTRRIGYAWVKSDPITYLSPAVVEGTVPYWASTHTLARKISFIDGRFVQEVVEESLNRIGDPFTKTGAVLEEGGSGYLEGLVGNGLEINVSWELENDSLPEVLTVLTRLGDSYSCDVSFNYTSSTLCIEGDVPSGDVKRCTNAGLGKLETKSMKVIVDASVIEVYLGGEVLTGRCTLPAGVKLEDSNRSDISVVGGTAKVDIAAFVIGSSYDDSVVA